MVLGIQRLETLGEIKWDFKHLRMEFMVNGKKHVIKGGTASINLKIVIVKQLDKLLPHSSWCFLIQLYSLQLVENTNFHCFINEVSLITEEKVLELVDQLLHKNTTLFQEPTQLPPYRRHDHRIHMKEGVNAISIRPYKHFALQKMLWRT